MIKNILFDMGNVIMRWDPQLFLARYPLSEDDKKLLLNEVFHSFEWVQLDRGSLDDEEALASMLLRIPDRLHDTARLLVTAWDDPMPPMEDTLQIIRELSEQGYGLYLLSNASRRHPDYWSKIPVSDCFGDRLFISALQGVLKPDPAYFEKALSLFGLAREECVFIDDNPSNVEGAVYAGIKGIVYHRDPGLLKVRLREMGVRI